MRSYFPKSHGRERVDDRRVLSGIIFVNRNGLRWRDAPKDYGPHKTLYNRWKRWGDRSVRPSGGGGAGGSRAGDYQRKATPALPPTPFIFPPATSSIIAKIESPRSDVP